MQHSDLEKARRRRRNRQQKMDGVSNNHFQSPDGGVARMLDSAENNTAFTPDQIDHLQRTVGNRATGALLRRQEGNGSTVDPSASLQQLLQRRNLSHDVDVSAEKDVNDPNTLVNAVSNSGTQVQRWIHGQGKPASGNIHIQRWSDAVDMDEGEVLKVVHNLQILANIRVGDKLSVLKDVAGKFKKRDMQPRELFKLQPGGSWSAKRKQDYLRTKKKESVGQVGDVVGDFIRKARGLLHLPVVPGQEKGTVTSLFDAAVAGIRRLRQSYEPKPEKAREFDEKISTGLLPTVIVIGAGPIGLASAIEAHMRGGIVTVYDIRSGTYNRDNVLRLKPSTLDILRHLGVYEELFGVSGEGKVSGDGTIPTRFLEAALARRAAALGIEVEYNHELDDVDDSGKTATIQPVTWETDEHGKRHPVPSGAAKERAFDVLIGAYGAKDSITEDKLGIDVTPIKHQYYAVGFFAEGQPEARLGEGITPVPGVILQSKHVRYLLVPIVAGPELAQVQKLDRGDKGVDRTDNSWLHNYLTTSAMLTRNGPTRDYGALTKSYWLRVDVKQADEFVTDFNAVLIGDAAASPDPGTGSGANTGFSLVGDVGDVISGYAESAGDIEDVLEKYGRAAKKKTDKMVG
jgi:2-polyprenyl-6-methoxyphenol hydroxylase-like FAD-dependent oxidoreductase